MVLILKYYVLTFFRIAHYPFVTPSPFRVKRDLQKLPTMSKSNYVSTNRSKHSLKCHLIFVCKYRKSILTGQLNDDLKRIFLSFASNSDFDIEVMETDRDHVHFLIRYIPGLSIAQIVRRLKQESTHQIWLLHPTLLRKQYWYQPILWPDGYFACSIGEASPETVRQYILSQG